MINLECAVIRGSDFASGKIVHYRMEPANLPCVTVRVQAGIVGSSLNLWDSS